MFSDNGTNFIGAERQLKEELDRLKGDEDLVVELKGLGVEWFVQPAQTPHFGGSHESMVHSVKNALYAALDSKKTGLLFEVGGLLNSRPLTYTSSDPDDFRALTPNDFLNRAPKTLPREHYGYVQRMTGQRISGTFGMGLSCSP